MAFEIKFVRKPFSQTRVGSAGRSLRKGFDAKSRKIIRDGIRTAPTGGFKAQFSSESQVGPGRSITSWVKSKRIFKRGGSSKTMQGTGRYRRAWLGGPGALVRYTKYGVDVGVKEGAFAFGKLFQKAQATLVKVVGGTRKAFREDFSVHLRARTAKLRVRPRRVTPNTYMSDEIGKKLGDHYFAGK